MWTGTRDGALLVLVGLADVEHDGAGLARSSSAAAVSTSRISALVWLSSSRKVAMGGASQKYAMKIGAGVRGGFASRKFTDLVNNHASAGIPLRHLRWCRSHVTNGRGRSSTPRRSPRATRWRT